MITKLNGHASESHSPRQWEEASFPAEPRAVRAARKFAGRLVAEPSERESVELMVSELATNAMRYADGVFSVRVSLRPRLRVEVRDASDALPVLKATTSESPGGRGLQIVNQLAANWGIERLDSGKVVWFEL
ncbi:MAG: ATP-binding protein [Actinomycetota bacterium]|nr:ATP-binding protein [Actinomycetota bacterium]